MVICEISFLAFKLQTIESVDFKFVYFCFDVANCAIITESVFTLLHLNKLSFHYIFPAYKALLAQFVFF